MVLGTQEPKFETQSGTSVVLTHSTIDVSEPEVRRLERESVITNYINQIHLGVHYIFQVKINLFKYGAGEAITKYNEYLGYLGQDVYLYPHQEGNAFVDSNGNKVLFRIQEVTPMYLETSDFKDLILITFRSNRLVDLSKLSLPENTIFGKKQNMLFPITDSDGNIQTYNITEGTE